MFLNTSLGQVIEYGLLGTCIYISIVVLYRLFFHPLAAYPGPLLARVTDWYMVFYIWKGDMHLKVFELHQKYGETVRSGPNSISINSANALSDIYAVRANVRKTDIYAVMSPSRRTPNTFSCVDQKVHSFKRRILGQLFSDRNLKGVEEHILDRVRRFNRAIGYSGLSSQADSPKSEGGWRSAVDMAVMSNYLFFDIISSLCYGESFNMLESSKLRNIPRVMSAINVLKAVCFMQPSIWRYSLDRVFLASLRTQILDFSAWIREKSEARMQLGSHAAQEDFYHHLLKAKDPETGKGLNKGELWSESMILILTGSDTTATTLSAVFFYLVHNPESLKKANAEIRTTFSDVESIRSGHQLNSCRYLRACINEALRCAPPVTAILPRQVLPGGFTTGNTTFPESTIVGTPIYTIHHNEAYFPDPFTFKPERWIVDPSLGYTDDTMKLAQSAYCPFSIGPRSCAGKNLAIMELCITIARTLFLYDIRLDASHTHGISPGCSKVKGTSETYEYRLKGWVTSGTDGPLVNFRPREL